MLSVFSSKMDKSIKEKMELSFKHCNINYPTMLPAIVFIQKQKKLNSKKNKK